MLAPLALLLEAPPVPGAATIGALVGLAALSTALGYVLYFKVLAVAGPVNLLLVTLIMPAPSFALGIAFLGEALAGRHLVGLAGIALGLAASTSGCSGGAHPRQRLQFHPAGRGAQLTQGERHRHDRGRGDRQR